jgi:hypothetical protein
MNGWERGGAIGTDAERLAVLRTLCTVINDAGPLFNAEPGLPTPEYAALQQWPGWQLSWTSITTLISGPGGMADKVSEATKLILAGDTAKAADALTGIKKDYAVALLAGRLCRDARQHGLIAVNIPGATMLELTSGGPIRGRSWMGQWTDELDDVCRYTEEAMAERKLGAKDKSEAILKFAGVRATAVLDGMETK